MNAYIRLMRLHKPIGTSLLLWPTYWALFLSAKGWPDIDLLIMFTLGVLVMTSAGCVINEYADRNIDQNIARTKERPLITGEVSPNSALRLFVFLLILQGPPISIPTVSSAASDVYYGQRPPHIQSRVIRFWFTFQ